MAKFPARLSTIQRLYCHRRGAWGLANDTQIDWVLIASSNHRGNMCGGYSEWYVIRVDASGATVAPALDGCNWILDVRVLSGQVEVDMSHPDLTIARETFTWDGVTLTSVLVPELGAAPAGAGAEVTRWIGGQNYDFFRDASERARLGSVMAPDDVQQLSAVMGVADRIVERNGWVILRGCQQHACNVGRGVVAIRIADGAVAAAILTGQSLQPRVFGLASDPTVAAAIAEARR